MKCFLYLLACGLTYGGHGAGQPILLTLVREGLRPFKVTQLVGKVEAVFPAHLPCPVGQQERGGQGRVCLPLQLTHRLCQGRTWPAALEAAPEGEIGLTGAEKFVLRFGSHSDPDLGPSLLPLFPSPCTFRLQPVGSLHAGPHCSLSLWSPPRRVSTITPSCRQQNMSGFCLTPHGLCPLAAFSLGNPTCMIWPPSPGLIAPTHIPDHSPPSHAGPLSSPPPQGCTLVVPLPEMLFHALCMAGSWTIRRPPQPMYLKYLLFCVVTHSAYCTL